jgi:hypothetical protein
MSKRLGWLEEFAQQQAKKMQKQASVENKEATTVKEGDKIIVDTDVAPKADQDDEITYQNNPYKVVDADFEDDHGPGLVLRALSIEADEDEDDDVEIEVEDDDVDIDDVDFGDLEDDLDELDNYETEEVEVDDTEDIEIDELGPEEDNEFLDEDLEVVDEEPGDDLGLDEDNEFIDEDLEVIDEGPTGDQLEDNWTGDVGEGKEDAQEYARNNPGHQYHIETQDRDVKDFNDAADKTQQQIEEERNTDRTTVDGYYSHNNILNDIVEEAIDTEQETSKMVNKTMEEPSEVNQEPIGQDPEDEVKTDKGLNIRNTVLDNILN